MGLSSTLCEQKDINLLRFLMETSNFQNISFNCNRKTFQKIFLLIKNYCMLNNQEQKKFNIG